MTAKVGGSSQPNKASKAKSSSQSGLLGLTLSFAKSQIMALAGFFTAISLAYAGFHRLQKDLGISPRECAAMLGISLALLFFFHTRPILRDKRRIAKLNEVKGSTEQGYFQLAPRDNEIQFKRADGKHEKVLQWLKNPPASLLYLTGSSGAGKSSLLKAWVLPKLERDGIKVIWLRGYQDPALALEEELKRPGVIWKRTPPEVTELNSLFESARLRVQPARIIVVFDQFEEFLILQEEQQRTRFLNFLATQASSTQIGSSLLLVFRAEYEEFIQDLNLPIPVPGANLQKVTAFTQRAALEFLTGSGLQIQDHLLVDVLREAAEVEETKGIIRPVTLNVCGLILSRFATGLPYKFRPGRLIRGFVHEAIFDKDVKEACPVLLPKLISDQVTKRPRTIADLALGTEFSSRQAQGVMFKREAKEWGIVHALDAEKTVWEISHDFLVPMIDLMLANWKISLWRMVRPWLPLGYVALLLLTLFLAPRFSPPLAELNDLGWTTHEVQSTNPEDRYFLQYGIKYTLAFHSLPPHESIKPLSRLRGRFRIQLTDIDKFDDSQFPGWSELDNLQELEIIYDQVRLTDISAARPLLHLSNVIIRGSSLKDAGLKNLPNSLTRLELSNDSSIRNDGLKNLPRSLTELELTTSGDFTDEGIKNLPPFLTFLSVDGRISNVGLKDLPRSLTTLYIDLCWRITDEGFKDLPRSLAVLHLPSSDGITGAGFRDLPKSLTRLELYGERNITNESLRDLPPSLTELELHDDNNITNAGLVVLPSTTKVFID